MKHTQWRVGIVGCGAIGSGMAESIYKDKKGPCRLTGLFDTDHNRSVQLARRLKSPGVARNTLESLIQNCDIMVEAVNAKHTRGLIEQALNAKKHVLAMSVGKVLGAKKLFDLARRQKCSFLLPSGAVSGIDAIKAAGLTPVQSITLTTRKPISGFKNNSYLTDRGIRLSSIKKEKVIYDGDVKGAVKHFPQNINVAATIALASRMLNKMRVRIITSPKYKNNRHEVQMISKAGTVYTRTENVVCPDNPKTSYLAVLSGIQTLKQFCSGIFIGT